MWRFFRVTSQTTRIMIDGCYREIKGARTMALLRPTWALELRALTRCSSIYQPIRP